MKPRRDESKFQESELKELEELELRRASYQRWYHAKRRPKEIRNVMAQLVQRKGYAQVRAAGARDKAWQAAVGEQLAPSTRVSGMRRGVLEILVANSLLMQEFTFRKEELLASLQEQLPEEGIKQIRFRLGKID